MKTFNFLLALFIFSLFNVQLYGQGAWIKQPTGAESTDNQFSAGGDDCLGYAKQNSQYIYFFDTHIHKWTKVDLGTPQHVRNMKGRGSVIFAYTDNVLIGYSSHSSSYDTIFYEGELLNPGGSGITAGYGCTERAVYFVTDKYFYVFDGVIGDWRRHSYLFPEPFFAYNARFLGGDDYIGIILPEEESYTHFSKIVCMAYSLPEHDFADAQYGGFYIGINDYEIMSHGFVTARKPPAVDSTFLTGYCSATNQFTSMTFPSETGTFNLSVSWYASEHYTKKTVAGFMLELPYGQGYSEKMYAYSTLLGSWLSSGLLVHDSTNESSYYSVSLGGTLAAACKVNYETDETFYVVYDSETGGFHYSNPSAHPVTNDAHTAAPNCANNVMMAHDSTHVWFFNPSLNTSFITEGFANLEMGYIVGEHFVAVDVWDIGQNNPDKLYIYNTATGNTNVIYPGTLHSSIYPIQSYDIFGFTAGSLKGNSVYFYSSVVDSIAYVAFQSSPVANIKVRDRVAVVTSQGGLRSYLYDGNTNGVTLIDFPFRYHELGSNFIFLVHGDTVTSYNYTKQEFSHVALNNLTFTKAADSIGLIWDNYHTQYVAYNGLSGNWVYLTPDGNWTYGDEAYGKTAIVIRSNNIYAFDPYVVSGIPEQENTGNPAGFRLLQNQPNPFNSYTTISYVLEKPGYVNLTICDMFGNKVAGLADENKAAGEYDVKFNSGTLGEGIYYYTLRFNNRSQTKKMVVVR